jgi:biopolymer transport protein ExbD
MPSSKSIHLPESTAETSPKDTLVVMVSGEDVVVDGHRIASVPELLASTDDLIAPLKAELEQQRANRQVVRTENAAEAQAITIMGDKDIPYQLLRKVMFSCARAGYTDVRFAVRQKAST